MSFRKPFRAVPIRTGLAYREKREKELALERSKTRLTGAKLAAVGLIIGAGLGVGILALPDGSLETAGTSVRSIAVEVGLVRARSPQTGDEWTSCHAARGAGTAPIFADEPGYRSGLDSDADGIACEPFLSFGF